ncbi:MAG: hypothetical protein K8T90_01375 [Planctomycetes bacterium]|nr:hypothetical protein [Planctomycetota bacterium]
MTGPETTDAATDAAAGAAAGAAANSVRRTSRRSPAPPRRVALWVGAVLVTAAILIGAVVATRSPPPEKMELHLRMLPREGGAAITDKDTRSAATDIDITIGELGIARREVSPVGVGRLRVVLPDSVRARMPEIRKRLSDPSLHVTIE